MRPTKPTPSNIWVRLEDSPPITGLESPLAFFGLNGPRQPSRESGRSGRHSECPTYPFPSPADSEESRIFEAFAVCRCTKGGETATFNWWPPLIMLFLVESRSAQNAPGSRLSLSDGVGIPRQSDMWGCPPLFYEASHFFASWKVVRDRNFPTFLRGLRGNAGGLGIPQKFNLRDLARGVVWCKALVYWKSEQAHKNLQPPQHQWGWFMNISNYIHPIEILTLSYGAFLKYEICFSQTSSKTDKIWS